MPISLPNDSDLQDSSSTEVRLELARRLHDGPAQELVALGYRLDALIGNPDLSSEHRTELREIRLDLITLTENLRDQLYLVSLKDLKSLESELIRVLPGFEVEVEIPESEELVPLENTLSLLILEIARNAAKHSRGSRFWVKLSLSDSSISIRVGENGAGPITLKERSLGLRLINAQVQTLNGTIELHSSQSGNEYLIEIPRQ